MIQSYSYTTMNAINATVTKEIINVDNIKNIAINAAKIRDAAKCRLANNYTRGARKIFEAAEDAAWQVHNKLLFRAYKFTIKRVKVNCILDHSFCKT